MPFLYVCEKVEAVIHELGQRMPLEKILDLKMPEELYDERQGEVWSTDTLLATFALDRGELNSLLSLLFEAMMANFGSFPCQAS